MKLKLIVSLVSDSTKLRREAWPENLYIKMKSLSDPDFLDDYELDANDWHLISDKDIDANFIELTKKEQLPIDDIFDMEMSVDRTTTPSPASSDEERDWGKILDAMDESLIIPNTKLIGVKESRYGFFNKPQCDAAAYEYGWAMKVNGR